MESRFLQLIELFRMFSQGRNLKNSLENQTSDGWKTYKIGTPIYFTESPKGNSTSLFSLEE